MRDVAGWEIGGEFYPLTFMFKWGDPALVYEVTGLTWDEFEEPILATANRNGDENVSLSALTLSGLLAVAIKRVHPDWSRSRVRKYVEGLDVAAAELVAPEVEDERGPPVETAGESSTTSAGKSESASEPPSNESTPSLSGTQTSPTSPEGPSATAT